MMDSDKQNESEQKELNEIQDIYDEAIIQIDEKRAANPTKRSVELPPLNIPPFDENFVNWRSFYDIFERAIIMDTSISNTAKLQFLKTLVRGEANQMISHLQTTEENFDTAWTLLKKRYNNEPINKIIRENPDKSAMYQKRRIQSYKGTPRYNHGMFIGNRKSGSQN